MQLSNGARDVTTSNNTVRVRRGNRSSRLESQEECPHGTLDDPSDLAQIQTVPGDSSHTENMGPSKARPHIMNTPQPRRNMCRHLGPDDAKEAEAYILRSNINNRAGALKVCQKFGM
uniref:(California timema) hypothetical protein n=1 Tax=Timema californicum TaxID=61474 RepID=A0A7R9PFP3_TIMCA|nr:unnamed protein product [Timema californicum]